mgnify:FL=1
MRKPVAVGAVVVMVPAMLLAASWCLFGWVSHDNPALGKVTAKRFSGRYVSVSLDANRDGNPNAETIWPWTEPYVGNVNAPCGDPAWILAREDRNFDGIWDTWQERLDRKDPCALVIKVDLDVDGNPDLIEDCAFHQSQERIEELDRQRGFPPLREALDAIAREQSRKR